jgi:hypothetical protein
MSSLTIVHLNKHSLILVSQPYQLLSMPKKDEAISELRETFLRVPTFFSFATPECQAIPTVRLRRGKVLSDARLQKATIDRLMPHHAAYGNC